MKRGLPAYVYLRKGKPYFERRGWQSQRIHAEPGTPEFAAEYAGILSGTPPVPPGRAFKALVASYKRSPRFKRLAPRTKADYEQVLEWVERKLGTLPADRMQRKDVIRARDANAERVRFANYIVQVLRVLMEHAIDQGWRVDNPAKGVKLLQSDGPSREPWPETKVAAFRSHAPARARLIFELCVGTGQRIGDVLKMRWDAIESDGIHVRQGKTKKPLWVPFTADLRAILAGMTRRGETIVADENGKLLRYWAAYYAVTQVRKMEGVKAEAFDLHALRYTTAAELGALGCSDEIIMAVTGHATGAMVAKYAGAARQKARALDAQGRRERKAPESGMSEQASEP